MAVGPQPDVGRRAGRAQPRGPRAAVDRDLDVVRGDAAGVARGPRDHEPLVALGRRRHPDARLRGRLVDEERLRRRAVQLRVAAVVPERPHPGAAQPVVVDDRVALLERREVVVVDLPPAGDAAVGRRAVLAPVGDVRAALERVPPAAVLGHQRGDVLVVHRGAVAVLGAAERLRTRGGVGGRPRPAVPREAEDDPARADAGRVRAHRVGEVVGGARHRVDGPGDAGPGGAVVVAHDEDRVGRARAHRGLERVVADEPGRVVGELVALPDLVQLRPDRLEQRDELVRVPARQRLEVEVDAVGAAIADGGRDLLREGEPRGAAAEQRALDVRLGGGPGEHADREHDPGAVLVGARDDRRQVGARPAAPAGRVRAVADPSCGGCRRDRRRPRSRRWSTGRRC